MRQQWAASRQRSRALHTLVSDELARSRRPSPVIADKERKLKWRPKGPCASSVRASRELDPEPPRYDADEVMCGRTRADRLRDELDRDARVIANALMDRCERRLIRHREREVVQADVRLAIERDGVTGIGDSPDGEGHGSVGNEHGRIGVVPGDFLEAQGSAKETRNLVKVANGETDVVHAVS
jgi:hypothetical protein